MANPVQAKSRDRPDVTLPRLGAVGHGALGLAPAHQHAHGAVPATAARRRRRAGLGHPAARHRRVQGRDLPAGRTAPPARGWTGSARSRSTARSGSRRSTCCCSSRSSAASCPAPGSRRRPCASRRRAPRPGPSGCRSARSFEVDAARRCRPEPAGRRSGEPVAAQALSGRGAGGAAGPISAERGRWREMGNLLFHLSLVGLLLSVAAGHLWGWRGDVIVPVGNTTVDAAGAYSTLDLGPWVDSEHLPPFSLHVEEHGREVPDERRRGRCAERVQGDGRRAARRRADQAKSCCRSTIR